MHNKGFTLIELIITIAIIAIVIGTAAPALQGYRNRQIESERANVEYVLNKAVQQYYALTGAYPNAAHYLHAGKYYDGASSETSFVKDLLNKTGISGDTTLYTISYADSPPAVGVTIP